MKSFSILLTLLVLTAVITSCSVEVDPTPSQIEYDLTISSTSGGSVTIPGEGTFTYEEGTEVIITATPASGYRFDKWAGDVAGVFNVNMAATTITMSRDYSILASFVAQYELIIESTEGGHVITPGEGTFKYDTGAVADLVAQPGEGYKFVDWTGDVGTVADVDAASTTITMNSDCSVAANFMLAHLYLDKIGPGLWGLGGDGEGVEATVMEAGMVVDFASDPKDNLEAEPQPGFGAGGGSTYCLEGDFDIRMSYELVTWPKGSGVRVGLIVTIPDNPDKFVNVERVGLGLPEWPHLSSREVYLVDVDHAVLGITSTDDFSGTLRLRRNGATVSCYYGTTEGWHEIYKAEWSTEDVAIIAYTWSHECLFGGEEVSVLMRTVEIIEGLP